MSVYGQDAEVSMLQSFVRLLDERTVIDVGAERGTLTAAMLDAGATAVWAVEPDPENAAAIRERFRDDGRVTVLEVAASDGNGEAVLRLATDPSGDTLSFAHTLEPTTDVDGVVAWTGEARVQRRTLESLVADGTLPTRVGILKVDTEGHDLAVLRGIGPLDPDVVMVEHWTNLPNLLGPCPWTLGDLRATLAPRGFANDVLVLHNGEFGAVKLNDGDVPEGDHANLVFLHDRVVDRLLPAAFEIANVVAQRSLDVGNMYAAAAWERMKVIEELQAALDRGVVRRALDAVKKRA